LLLSTQVAPNGSNLSGVADTALDQLLTAVRTTTDQSLRQTAISALEKYVSTNVLMLPICFADYGFVVSQRVQNVSTNQIADPSGRFWDVLDWRLASDG
jgi:ABC-type oligopeptide transport system substrate-binding subunit